MKFGPVPLAEAAGKILAHSLLDADGHKLFGKGHILTAGDLEVLRPLNLETVVVAALAPTDLGENEAARRVGMRWPGRACGSARRAWGEPICSRRSTDRCA
jgi:molybdenum cofactor cytidylyltransferase